MLASLTWTHRFTPTAQDVHSGSTEIADADFVEDLHQGLLERALLKVQFTRDLQIVPALGHQRDCLPLYGGNSYSAARVDQPKLRNVHHVRNYGLRQLESFSLNVYTFATL